MITSLRLKAVTAAIISFSGLPAVYVLGIVGAMRPNASVERPTLVEVLPGSFAYRMAGEFNQAGRPVSAPLVQYRLEGALDVMRHQVTVAEYERCVAAKACEKLAANVNQGPDYPVVQVSWEDATAYAAWLSASTGEAYRLPTDEEWAYVAGSRFRDGGLGQADDPNDPSKHWLAGYDQAVAGGNQADRRPRSVGSFGANERGLLDISGNVWEWTNTCFVRRSLDQKGRPTAASVVNCGVRVVEGEHRTYLPNFIRDARGWVGGCAVGEPPSNLGFRLMREPASRLSSAGLDLRVSTRGERARSG